MIEVSVFSAMPARGRRSRSKRPTSSATKCCASAAEPPLPQARILPLFARAPNSTSTATASGSASSFMLCSSVAAASRKCDVIREVISMGAIISWGRDAGLTRRNGFSPCRNRPVAGRAGPFSPRPGRHRAATGQRRIRRRPRRSARPAGRRASGGRQARQPVRGRWASRRCLAAPMLAAAPPKRASRRARTSTKTSTAPSRMARSISP